MDYERGYFLWKCWMLLALGVLIGGSVLEVRTGIADLGDMGFDVGCAMAFVGVCVALSK